MQHKKSIRRGFTLVELLVVILILATLAGFSSFTILKQVRKKERITAINNGREVMRMMWDFNAAMGSYPDVATAERLEKDGYLEGREGDFPNITSPVTSNDYLRQLFVFKRDTPEKSFFFEMQNDEGLATRKPDENKVGGQALAKGENGFAYLLQITENGDEVALRQTSAPNWPVLVAPLGSKNGEFKFNYKSFDGGAMAVLNDTSAQEYNVIEGTGIAPGLIPKDDQTGEPMRDKFKVTYPDL